MIAELELSQKIFIANEDEGEGRLGGQVQSQQQPQFLQSSVGGVLSVIHDDDQGLALVFGQIAGKLIEVAFTADASPLAQAARQTGQQSAAAQGRLGEVHRSIEAGFQLAHPAAGQAGFAHAVASA
jgi:hypothetical protein